MTKEPVKIVLDIVLRYLGFSDQQGWIFNQQKVIPNTPGPFVIVHYLGSKPYATTAAIGVDEDDNTIETISTQNQDLISIEIISQDNTARGLYPKISAALKGNYSLQQQEKYNFRIAENPTNIRNISSLDGGSMLTRIVIDTYLLSWAQYTTIIEYFDQFSDTVISNP